ncbi:MAG: fluoride efflux transporter CrcB [Magnetococcales bacterium]|nr:fluoride efflux transporter CrcB [Magnetococcales bacterium]MBF0156321.1 fluoride efflux transporter CrcB [Magnetococcales bacterium]
MWKSILVVSLGASLGALLRWGMGNQLNGYFPAIPLGTLTVNLVGGYIIGLAIALFDAMPGLSPEWRLLVITGFCGGLTTFSTFSAEILSLLQRDRLPMAMVAIAIHVGGSLLMTLLGLLSWQWLRSR